MPTVFQIRLQNCLPRAASTVRTKQLKFLCSPVPESLSILGILQPDTYSFLCTAKVQGKALFRSCFLLRCQPEVELVVPGSAIVCQGEYATSWELSAMNAAWTIVAGAPGNLCLFASITDWEIFHIKSAMNDKYQSCKYEQAHKLCRCNSYLRNLKLSITHPLTDRGRC